MTQEEKAKRYEEALERAKNLHKDAIDMGNSIRAKQCEIIFPELKESEDERIREALIALLKFGLEDGSAIAPGFNETKEQALTWLEKQGEKPQGKTALEAINEEKVDNQNCVKPTDEPKFHKGEWLTENHPNNYARFVQILEIVNVQGKKRYRISRDLHNDEDIVECRFIEDNWHHFNIHDAKDGDVLSWDYNLCIALFKNIQDEEYFNSYGFVGHCDGEFEVTQCYHYIKGAHPATKEQRDTLFQKMKKQVVSGISIRKNERRRK